MYDLGSTHGTFLNKKKVKSNLYIPLRCGDLIKFASSSRLFHFTSKNSEIIEIQNQPENQEDLLKDFQSKAQQSSEATVFSGSYSELKDFMKKNVSKEQQKGESSDDEENEANADLEDSRNRIDDASFFTGGSDTLHDDQDDFYDRTKSKSAPFKRPQLNAKVLTSKNISEHLKQLDDSIADLKKQIQSIEIKSSSNVDDIDDYLTSLTNSENVCFLSCSSLPLNIHAFYFRKEK